MEKKLRRREGEGRYRCPRFLLLMSQRVTLEPVLLVKGDALDRRGLLRGEEDVGGAFQPCAESTRVESRNNA